MGKLSKNHFFKCISEGLMHVAAWYHGNSRSKFTKFGNKLRLATPRCVPTKSVHSKRCRAYVHFCNEAESCAYWLVNETLWHETETRPRRLIFSPRRDRDRDLPTFSRDRDETETCGNYVSRPSRDRDVETETTSLSVAKPCSCVSLHARHASLAQLPTTNHLQVVSAHLQVSPRSCISIPVAVLSATVCPLWSVSSAFCRSSSAVCSANPHNRHGFSWILVCCSGIVEWLTTSAPWPQSNIYWFMVALCHRADHIYFHAVVCCCCCSSFFFLA